MRHSILCLLCSALCLLCVSSVRAEHHGQVTFAGVPVPGATVTATQGDKKFVVITNEMGAYAFPDLPEGAWTIEVDMLGFAKLKGDTATAAWDLKMLPARGNEGGGGAQ